jgi:glycosyltransferase involved in cell wall biosynthesis
MTLSNVFVSLVCPVYNEEKHIAQCLDSILGQTYSGNIEILLVDGFSSDRTRKIIHSYCLKHSNIILLNNPIRFTPVSLNIGVKQARGEYVIRIDAHSIYPNNYIETLIHSFIQLNADNVGCVIKTLPATNSIKCRSIAYVLSHPFGVGNSYFRIGTSQILKVDTVPFGCFKRSLFEKIGLFDEELLVNQDDEFNSRIIKNGGEIYLLPDISVNYLARDSIYKTIRMFYQYGLYKPLVNSKIGATTTIRQIFPLLFLLGICLGPFIGLFYSTIFFLYFFILFLYFFIAIYFSINSLNKIRERVVLYMPILFFMVHISYGYGYLLGQIKVLFGKRFNKNQTVTR